MDADMKPSAQNQQGLPESSRALRPVSAGPGVLVHPDSDRRLATAHWLLSTLPDHARERARNDWSDHKVALLPLGGLFSAVRIPARMILAVTGGRSPSGEVDAILDEVLEGGPVICDPGSWYYALVPASMPRTWRQAASEWHPLDVGCLGRESYLGVPRLDVTQYDPATRTYWSVPMPSAATLCAPLAVARLIAAGVHQLGEEAGLDA